MPGQAGLRGSSPCPSGLLATCQRRGAAVAQQNWHKGQGVRGGRTFVSEGVLQWAAVLRVHHRHFDFNVLDGPRVQRIDANLKYVVLPEAVPRDSDTRHRSTAEATVKYGAA